MNWEAVGAIGEIVGAIAVIATLIYLSMQVRQSSKLAKATIHENRAGSSQRISLAFSEVAEILAKLHNEEELTQTENIRIDLISRAMFRDFEAYSYQNKAGLLETSEWNAIQEMWRDIMTIEGVRTRWEEVKGQYSITLHEDIREVLSE